MENPNEISGNNIEPAHDAEQNADTANAADSENISIAPDAPSADTPNYISVEPQPLSVELQPLNDEPQPVSDEPQPCVAYCPNCGTLLESSDRFCPKCGTQVMFDGNGLAQAPIPPNIMKKPKSKKRKRIAIIAGSAAALIVAAAICVAGFFYYKGIANDVILQLSAPSPSASRITEKCDSLGSIGKLVFRDKLVKDFVKIVKRNQYTAGIETLVNSNDIDKYRAYKRFADSLNISKEDGTNVVSYIDNVLKLEEYEKYNGLYNCVTVSSSDLTNAFDYLTEAGTEGNYYLTRSDLYLSYTHAKKALTSAQDVSDCDDLCSEYVTAISTVVDTVYDLYNYNRYSVVDTDSAEQAIDTLTDLTNEVSDVESTVEDIIYGFPIIK